MLCKLKYSFYIEEGNIVKELELLTSSLKEYSIELSDVQEKQFMKFYEILIEKNKVMNLTGITELNEVIIKHFVDSLSIVQIYDMREVNSIIDMGTGAGFPGVPIKIVYPHIHVTLMDSLNKRINFLKEACQYCELDNVDFVHGRAEDLGKNNSYREKFDLCVSRAVANLSVLSEYCIPFVKVGGSFICYKSGNCEDEIKNAQKAIKILSSEIVDRKEFMLPNSDNSRILLNIYKKKELLSKYPRKAGVPLKNPII